MKQMLKTYAFFFCCGIYFTTEGHLMHPDYFEKQKVNGTPKIIVNMGCLEIDHAHLIYSILFKDNWN